MRIRTVCETASSLIRNNQLLLLIFLFGMFLRIYRLGAESIWFDEAISVAASKLGFIEQIKWNLTASDNNPPLYYAFLHVWVLIFGDSEFAVRLPSAIFGSVNILLIYVVGKMLFNRKTGLMAAFILAISVFHIRFSQETRVYSMSTLLTLVSYYFFLKLMSRRNRLDSAGYVISSVLLMYSHYFGMFIVLSQNIYILLQFLFKRRRGTPDYRSWIMLQLLLGFLYLPGLYFLYRHSLGLEKGFWLSAPTLKVVLDCFDLYTGSAILLIVFTMLSLYSAMGAGSVNLRLIKGEMASGQPSRVVEPGRLSYSNAIGLLFIWLFTPIAVPFMISYITIPIFFYRYTIVGSLAFYLLAAAGTAETSDNRLIILIAGLVLVLSALNVLGYYQHVDKPEWRDGISYIESNAHAGDIIVAYPDYETASAAYYSKRNDMKIIPFTDEFLSGSSEENREYWLVMCDRFKDNVGNTKGVIERKLSQNYDVLSIKDYEYLYIYQLRHK
jgi:mannosyltransferase